VTDDILERAARARIPVRYVKAIDTAIDAAIADALQRTPSAEVVVPTHTIVDPLMTDRVMQGKPETWIKMVVTRVMKGRGYEPYTKGTRGVLSFLYLRPAEDEYQRDWDETAPAPEGVKA